MRVCASRADWARGYDRRFGWSAAGRFRAGRPAAYRRASVSPRVWASSGLARLATAIRVTVLLAPVAQIPLAHTQLGRDLHQRLITALQQRHRIAPKRLVIDALLPFVVLLLHRLFPPQPPNSMSTKSGQPHALGNSACARSCTSSLNGG